MSRSRIRQRGYVLLIVLWTLGLLALVGTRILATGRQETNLAAMQRDAATLKAAADGAVQRAIFATLDPSGQHWDADGTPRSILVGGVAVSLRLENETDKVNLNLASPELLRGLMRQVGADSGTATTVAAGIVQWREAVSGSDAPAAPGTKNLPADRGYAPPGMALTSLDELNSITGMTPALLERLLPHVTVFTDRDPDGSTHDPIVAQVLSALGQGGGGEAGGEPDLVSITADARGPGRARFAVRVTVQTNAQAEVRRYRILSYERLWGIGP